MKAIGFFFTVICLAVSASGQINSMKQFIFGHSLIVHDPPINPTPSNETTVPHWMAILAQEAGKTYAAAGKYGFLPQHRILPPISQWGFDTVTPAWDDNQYDFDSANFNNVLITAANFAQWQGPNINYHNDTVSPLSCTREISDWVKNQEPNCKIYIYENWPDMAGYLTNGFPPNATEWNNYNTYLNSTFHDWWIEYHDSLLLQRPQDSIRMIPVGPILSNILTQAPYNQIPVANLYEDDAPHGRPTIYFLAGLVTYMATYQEIAPLNYQVPNTVDSVVRANYNAIVNIIWTDLLNFNIAGTSSSRVFFGAPNTTTQKELLRNTPPILYPNPTNGITQLQNGNYTIAKVTDNLGRRIKHTANQVDLSDYPKGVYYVTVLNELIGKLSVHKTLKL